MPRKFVRYQSYKRWLQREFERACVYCRQPDSLAPNLNFGVDHYRPKSIKRFANLVCDYKNLFYCCGNCNSRKGNDWPIDELRGPYVANPCDHVMAEHIRFDSNSGKMIPRSEWGEHIAELLQLNDQVLVGFRNGVLQMLQMCDRLVADLQKQVAQLTRKQAKGQIANSEYAAEMRTINARLLAKAAIRNRLAGTVPLEPISTSRFGVELNQ